MAYWMDCASDAGAVATADRCPADDAALVDEEDVADMVGPAAAGACVDAPEAPGIATVFPGGAVATSTGAEGCAVEAFAGVAVKAFAGVVDEAFAGEVVEAFAGVAVEASTGMTTGAARAGVTVEAIAGVTAAVVDVLPPSVPSAGTAVGRRAAGERRAAGVALLLGVKKGDRPIGMGLPLPPSSTVLPPPAGTAAGLVHPLASRDSGEIARRRSSSACIMFLTAETGSFRVPSAMACRTWG